MRRCSNCKHWGGIVPAQYRGLDHHAKASGCQVALPALPAWILDQVRRDSHLTESIDGADCSAFEAKP
jgi:hypothetical protein